MKINPPSEMRFKAPTKEDSNAPQMPTNPPMPKCKPPKDDWEIPSFMKRFKPKETVTFYVNGKPYATFEVEDEEQAVPVIRCKDCEHWQCDDVDSYCDELGIFGTDMNSYCSYAKKGKK